MAAGIFGESGFRLRISGPCVVQTPEIGSCCGPALSHHACERRSTVRGRLKGKSHHSRYDRAADPINPARSRCGPALYRSFARFAVRKRDRKRIPTVTET